MKMLNIAALFTLFILILNPVANADRMDELLNDILKTFLGNNDIDSDYNVEEHFCCTPNKWEATAFITTGDIFRDAETFFAYINGSGRIAYDKSAGKSYVAFNISEYTPLMPEPDHSSMTVIKDTKKGIQYNIDESGACDKRNITKSPLALCIPKNGNFLCKGQIGGGVNLYTYQFHKVVGGTPVQTTATVNIDPAGNCIPMVVNWMVGSVGVGFLYNLDVQDLSYTIKDESVFIPPSSCN